MSVRVSASFPFGEEEHTALCETHIANDLHAWGLGVNSRSTLHQQSPAVLVKTNAVRSVETSSQQPTRMRIGVPAFSKA
jgi:hypothetical protein